MSMGVMGDEAARAARARVRGGGQVSIAVKSGEKEEHLAISTAPGAVSLSVALKIASEWLEAATVQVGVEEWSAIAEAQAKKDAIIVAVDTLEYSPIPGNLRMYTKFGNRVSEEVGIVDMLTRKVVSDTGLSDEKSRGAVLAIIDSLGGWGFAP